MLAIALLAASLPVAISLGRSTPVDVRPPNRDWIQSRAVSLDVDSDFEALEAAIGDARVVLLGEPAHSDGGALRAKTRLAIHLHEHLGFDILAWEAGVWSCQRFDSELKRGADPLEAARSSLPDIWAASAQIQPLFEHGRDSWSGPHPLRMAGFDTNLTGTGAWSDMATEVNDWLRQHATTDEFPAAEIAQLAAGIQEDPSATTSRPASSRQVRDLLIATDRLLEQWPRFQPRDTALHERHAEVGRIVHHARDAAELIEMVRPAIRLGPIGLLPPFQKLWIRPMLRRREEQMAANLLRLLEQNPDSRILVWAASAHTARGFGDMKYPAGRSDLSRKVSMGEMLVGALGRDQVYALSIVSRAGSVGYPGQDGRSLPAFPADSFEGSVSGLGTFFLDFAGDPADARRGLGDALSVGALGYGPIVGDWTRVVDGLLVLEQTEPSRLATGWTDSDRDLPPAPSDGSSAPGSRPSGVGSS